MLGFGVLNWHPSRRKMSDAQSSASKASDAEQSDEGSSLFGALSPGGKRLQRSRTEKKVAGVCGGIAKYFDLDPTLVRIAFVVGVIASGGPFVVAYAALAFVMPKEPKS
jgi:phage shock protein C